MTFPQNWPDVFVKSCRSWEYLSAHSARFLALVPAEGQVGRLAQALAHPGLLRHPGRSFLRRSQLAGTANFSVNGRLRLRNLVSNHILKKWKRLESVQHFFILLQSSKVVEVLLGRNSFEGWSREAEDVEWSFSRSAGRPRRRWCSGGTPSSSSASRTPLCNPEKILIFVMDILSNRLSLTINHGSQLYNIWIHFNRPNWVQIKANQ